MRILFTRFPLESAHGGSEVQTSALMRGLRDRGHHVMFLGSCPVLNKRCEEMSIEHHHLDIGPPPVTKFGAVSFAWRKFEMQRKLVDALSQYKPDVMIMLSISEKLVLTKHAFQRGIRVLWLEHDPVGRWLTKNPWLPALRSLSDVVTTVCVSELSKKIFIDLGWNPEKVVAIPNGVAPPPGPLPPLRAERGNKLQLGCVARLQYEKGVDVLIAAVHDLPNIQLTIIGKGSEEGYLRSLIEGESKVTVQPSVPDLATFYLSLDALILPSRTNDPFGLTAAEAMMLGIPVIVTDACGIAGYLQNGKGALIAKADDVQSLRDAIGLLRDEGMYEKLSTEGRRTASTLFSLNVMIDRYEALCAKNLGDEEQ